MAKHPRKPDPELAKEPPLRGHKHQHEHHHHEKEEERDLHHLIHELTRIHHELETLMPTVADVKQQVADIAAGLAVVAAKIAVLEARPVGAATQAEIDGLGSDLAAVKATVDTLGTPTV